MTTGCGDTLSLEDLQTAKKHQLFEAEVITGKQGGVTGGANIDYATNQVTGQTQKTLPATLRDAGFRPASFTFTTGGTLSTTDSDKVVYDPVSKTWFYWSGALPKVIPAATNPLLDALWLPKTDPNLRTDLAASTGAALVGTSAGVTVEQAIVNLKKSVVINASDYKTDSNTWSQAINAAIAAAKLSAGSYLQVRIPASSTPYLVSDILLDGPVHLIGDGKLNTTLAPETTTSTCIKVTSQFATVSSLTIQATVSPNTATGIEIKTSLVTVKSCSFAFLKHGILSSKGLSAAELDIRHNRFAASMYGVAFLGGQINSRFLMNTYSACKWGLYVAEDLSLGVSGTTEGIKIVGDLFYSCGDSATNASGIEIVGTRWTWLTDVMVDLSAGTAVTLTDAKYVTMTNGYYSSNASTNKSCVEVKGDCVDFLADGVKFSDSREYGLKLSKVGSVFPGRASLRNCLFQFNDINAAQQGDILINSVPSVSAVNCTFTANKPNGIAIIDNVSNTSTLTCRSCNFYGQVFIGTPASCRFYSYDSPTHPDKQQGVVTIPNGATFIDVPKTTVSLVGAGSALVFATAAGATVALSGGVVGSSVRIIRVGAAGDLVVQYQSYLNQ